MTKFVFVGPDIVKNRFQVHGTGGEGRLVRSICLLLAVLTVSACVRAQRPNDFMVVDARNERGARYAQATGDEYCGRTGRYALATDRQWNYVGFQCVDPANTMVRQTPIPPR
jgi:hypothetical protein